jgi:small conductance mechanosensitive channel
LWCFQGLAAQETPQIRYEVVIMEFEILFTVLIQFLPRFGAAVAIFFGFWLAGRLLRGIVRRFGNTRRLSQDVVNMMVQIAETSLLIFGTITALGTIGIDIWAMVAGLGLVGFALGFALKDLLSNFLAGFLILLYNPFVRGDVIAVSGNEGQVVEINMRYTVLQNNEKRILIPNSTLFQNNVIVFKRAEERIPGGDLG